MNRRKRDRSEWQRLVGAFETSGLSAEEFAGRHGVGASTLAWWRWRLKRAGGTDRASGRDLVPFVRVEVSQDDGEALGAGAPVLVGPMLELPGGLVLRFPVDTDADYVSAVVACTALRLDRGAGAC